MARTPQNQLPATLRPTVIGNRIRIAREALGLEKSEMADAIGADRSSWTKWEDGKRQIPEWAALRMCDRFGLTLDFLFRGRLEGTPEEVRAAALRDANFW